MKLFPDIVRDINGPKTNSQSAFDFLNRSKRLRECDIRTRLENWFSRYPEDEKNRLVKEFGLKNNENKFHSTFFELALHELLINLDYKVTVHPQLSDTEKNPDFLAEISSDDGFYMEAIHFPGKSDKERGQETIIDNIKDDLNERINSPDFFINVDINGNATTQPRRNAYIPNLQRFIDDQDYSAVSQASSAGKSRESAPHVYKHEDMRLKFSLIPKPESQRGSDSIRNIGIVSEFKWSNRHATFRDKIQKKGKRYGILNRPFIISVNHLHLMDRIDIEQVLFGNEEYILRHSPNGSISENNLVSERRLKGLWTKSDGPKYRRISGVLVVCGLNPWVTSEAGIRLFQNPWATHPCPSSLSRLPQAVVRNKQFCYEEGESLQSLLRMQ